MDAFGVDIIKNCRTGRATAVDVDIFANNITDPVQLYDLENILSKFRRTKHTIYTMDSTHYAVVRAFLEFKQEDRLLEILENRLLYGIFPDYYSMNMLLDRYIEDKNYRDAARVASLMMLQEDFEHPLFSRLALYACHMDSGNPKDEPVVEAIDEQEDEDDDDDVIIKRVGWIKNPYFDDHFDLKDHQLKLGKTLMMLGRLYFNDSIVGHSYELIGWGLYKKWDQGLELLEQLLNSEEKPAIFQEALERFQAALDCIEEDDKGTKIDIVERFTEASKKLSGAGKVSDEDLNACVEKLVEKDTLHKLEPADIAAQQELFIQWEEARKAKLEQQIEEYMKQERIRVIRSKKEYITKREELFSFFDSEDRIKIVLDEERQRVERKLRHRFQKKRPEADEFDLADRLGKV
ncbi:PREDICTED: 28S ribosomal protein S27, mitochondrial-like [Priapulus caudatus]|uniref:28S ribosomal protein S27, mitochondrial-like n=1 Tax=Priapulus caudatus TaxID=37621 RepID=A0ABM1EE90_PRICU|nr:PREDICTED: 28S ribosomal protein S27, mitochondrial-like [Priapulus caudatus]